MALKLDIEKAYDNLSWEFLFHTLPAFQFPQQFIHLIMTCVTSVTFTVSANGHKSAEWKPTKGLRQGDPLSPYLFILCMDMFIHLAILSTQSQSFKALRANKNGPPIPILSFTDDCFLFCDTTNSIVSTLQNNPEIIATAAGQTINWGKSKVLFAPNVPITDVSH